MVYIIIGVVLGMILGVAIVACQDVDAEIWLHMDREERDVQNG